MAKIKSHIVIPLLLLALALNVSAQTTTAVTPDKNILNHLNLGVNAGTNGLGLDLAMPITEKARVRAGVEYMPRTCIPLTFNLMAYSGIDDGLDQDTKFNRMSEMLKDITGFEVDKEVKMNAKGTMVDFKFLVDFFPLRNNKQLYATAGFFWGSSKVGHIENHITEAPSLIGVLIYNKLYDYFIDYHYLDINPELFGVFPVDPMMGDELRPKFERYGRVGAHMGNFADGTPYLMEPDENGMVRADMYVHKFKPYVGIGFTTDLTKNKRWKLNVDAGAMFWGKPKILTHEHYINTDDGSLKYGAIFNGDDPDKFGPNINVATDVTGIGGRVGTYVKYAKGMHVFPSINLTISCQLF